MGKQHVFCTYHVLAAHRLITVSLHNVYESGVGEQLKMYS